MRHPFDVLEIWRPIEDFPYEVSSFGRVRRSGRAKSARIGHVLTPFEFVKGRHGRQTRLAVSLYKGNKKYNRYVSRLVCQAFWGNPPTPRHEAAHGDGNATRNYATNLRWATHRENFEDAIEHGTIVRVLTPEQVVFIRESHDTYKVLARQFGVSEATVAGARTRRYYANV